MNDAWSDPTGNLGRTCGVCVKIGHYLIEIIIMLGHKC